MRYINVVHKVQFYACPSKVEVVHFSCSVESMLKNEEVLLLGVPDICMHAMFVVFA